MIAKDFKTRVLPMSSKLLRFCTHFLNDEEVAKDVVQDLFLKALAKARGSQLILRTWKRLPCEWQETSAWIIYSANKTTSIDR